MTTPDTDTLAGLREELRLIGCHQNGDARCTCSIGADALDAIDALRAQAAKDKARIERLVALVRDGSDLMRGECENLKYSITVPSGGLSADPLDRWAFDKVAAMKRWMKRAALEDRE